MTPPPAAYDAALAKLRADPATWLVTGAAGFIGSHLIETLLGEGQTVVGLDNFETGSRENLEEVRLIVGDQAWAKFSFIEGDIRDLAVCEAACAGVDYVLHEAALGSVALSVEDPLKTHAVNVTGFTNMLEAIRRQGVKRLVYAASSATYGDCDAIPAREETIGNQLSPYALSKYANELYADVFARVYGVASIGLRYFNVFGPRQDPEGPYAAVIPKWTRAMLAGETVFINGDGLSTRDFCYVGNVVQANILAATAQDAAVGQVFNVAAGHRTDLITLQGVLAERLVSNGFARPAPPQHRDPLPGEVRHSQADISKISAALGYAPSDDLASGLVKAAPWYIKAFAPEKPSSSGR